MAYDEKMAQRVRRILATQPKVTERNMMGALCFVVDGDMCCCVKDDALMVRVDTHGRERALAEPGVQPATLRGRVMKAFVLVDAAAIKSHAALRRWVERGLGVSAEPKTGKRLAAAPAATIDPKFAAVVAAFASDRHVTAGKMMASTGLKVNGKIFAMMSRGKFVAKLPKERVTELVRSGAGVHFDPRRDGRVMKEWLELSGTKPSWIALAREAYRFVSLARR